MANSKANLSSQLPGDGGANWQQLIWREWRTCDDVEYAGQLFDLVVNEPTDRTGTVILILLGSLTGALGGWLLTLAWMNVTVEQFGTGVTLGLLAGGLSGWLADRLLRRFNRFTWGAWLQALIPTMPLLDRTHEQIKNSLYLGLVAGLASGIGVGVPGALFFGQLNPQFWSLLVGLLGLFIAGLVVSRRVAIVGLLIGLATGLPFGLFFGLGLAQIVGLLVGPFDVPNSARIVGLAVGLGAGLFLGRWTGLLGTLIWQIVAAGLVMIAGANLVLWGWLLGLLGGGVIGSLSRWRDLPAGQLELAEVYHYRALLLWWSKRPPAATLEAALRQHATGERWTSLFRSLDRQQIQSKSIKTLLGRLQGGMWTERFIARHTLVALGHESLSHLLHRAVSGTRSQRRLAAWLAHSIGHETRLRLAAQARRMICPDCLTGCGPHLLDKPPLNLTYYGCRTCGQSREFLYCPQGVTAVLDRGWTEASPHRGGFLHKIFGLGADNTPKLTTRAQNDGLLRVNWLARRELFDFDRVEIIQATDEEVERFVVQVGNDTDPLRTPRYAELPCVVGPGCHLSENSLRILERTFGRVE